MLLSSVSSVALVAATVTLLATIPPRLAQAQQVVANGTTQTASGTIDTGTAAPTAGYTLWALNNGVITSSSPLVLLNNTSGVPIVVRAESGGQITLFNGTTATAGPASSNSSPGTVLSADGVGSLITATDTHLIAQGNSTYGATAGNGGSIILTGGVIDTFGTFAVGHGLNALVGGTITSTGQTINATGFGGYAAGGVITIQDATITERLATGNVAGLRSDLPSGLITATNVNITTSGANSFGVVTADGGTLRINDSTINTSGSGAHGLNSSQSNLATGTRSLVEATNVSVTTTGVSGFGALVYNGGLMNLNTVNIQTSGDFAYGIDVLGYNTSPPSGPPISTVLNGTNVRINATGNSAYGAIVEAAGTLNLTDSSVTATGPTAGGVFVGDSGSTGTLLRTTVTSTQYDGGRAADSGHLFITDSNVTAGRHGIRANGGVAGDPSIVVFSGGTLTAAADAFNAHDTFAQLLLQNGTAVTTGSGNLLNVLSNDPATLVSNVQFTTANIVATGNIISDAASIANVNLTSNSTITGIEQNTFTTVDASSKWIMNGNSDIHSLTLAGQVLYTPPVGDPTQLASYKTLTTQNFVGNGGLLGLNTFLGSDPSPSDRLVINGGNAGGNALLRIANTTGAGALTTGNGILVVDTINSGTTNPGTFALSGPVAAGPFEYTLFRSSVDASNPEAWYLRSTLNCTLAPTLPQCQTPTPPPPNFRVETSLYAAIPSMALLYGRNLLDTLHERVGEEFDERSARNALASGYYKAAPPNPAPPYFGWGRVIGMNGVQQGASQGVLSPGTGGPRFDYTFLGLQAGMDFFRQDRPDGSRDHAGSYFAIGGNRGRVTHFTGTQGDSDFAAYTLGGYWTHFGPAGWYLDAILQGTFYDINSTANRGLPTLKTAGQGVAASLEGGYPFKFAGGWFIEPQAQLVYQNVHINDASDIAAQIRFADVDSLLGRIGARFGRTWLDDGLRTITAWIRPNLWNEFRGNPVTSFSSEAGFVPFYANLGGLWGELNAGVSARINPNTTLYANASYQSRFDGGGFAYTGKAGLRVSW